MNNTTKILGKILLVFLLVATVCMGGSLIVIYAHLGHAWDNILGMLAFLLYLLSIPLLLAFLISWIVSAATKK